MDRASIQHSPATDFNRLQVSLAATRCQASWRLLCLPAPVSTALLFSSPHCFNFSHWLIRQDGETVAVGLHLAPCRSALNRPVIAFVAVYLNCRVCPSLFDWTSLRCAAAWRLAAVRVRYSRENDSLTNHSRFVRLFSLSNLNGGHARAKAEIVQLVHMQLEEAVEIQGRLQTNSIFHHHWLLGAR